VDAGSTKRLECGRSARAPTDVRGSSGSSRNLRCSVLVSVYAVRSPPRTHQFYHTENLDRRLCVRCPSPGKTDRDADGSPRARVAVSHEHCVFAYAPRLRGRRAPNAWAMPNPPTARFRSGLGIARRRTGPPRGEGQARPSPVSAVIARRPDRSAAALEFDAMPTASSRRSRRTRPGVLHAIQGLHRRNRMRSFKMLPSRAPT
jgi:hypothetical protein